MKKWTRETLIEKALKYKRRVDLYKGSLGAYKAALKSNILDEICAHMPKTHKNRKLIK